jgi:hypothetical protein
MNVKLMEAMWRAVPLFTLLKDVKLSEVSLRMMWKALSSLSFIAEFHMHWAAISKRYEQLPSHEFFFSLGYIGSLEMWRRYLLTIHVPWSWVPILTRTIRHPETSEPETLSDILTYTWILFWLGKVCVCLLWFQLWPYRTIGFSCEQCQHKNATKNIASISPQECHQKLYDRSSPLIAPNGQTWDFMIYWMTL